jgi:hypothetical protein
MRCRSCRERDPGRHRVVSHDDVTQRREPASVVTDDREGPDNRGNQRDRGGDPSGTAGVIPTGRLIGCGRGARVSWACAAVTVARPERRAQGAHSLAVRRTDMNIVPATAHASASCQPCTCNDGGQTHIRTGSAHSQFIRGRSSAIGISSTAK